MLSRGVDASTEAAAVLEAVHAATSRAEQRVSPGGRPAAHPRRRALTDARVEGLLALPVDESLLARHQR
jgi:hypothetical protein